MDCMFFRQVLGALFRSMIRLGMAHTSGAKTALLVKHLDSVGSRGRFARGTPSVIGEVFEFVIPAPIVVAGSLRACCRWCDR